VDGVVIIVKGAQEALEGHAPDCRTEGAFCRVRITCVIAGIDYRCLNQEHPLSKDNVEQAISVWSEQREDWVQRDLGVEHNSMLSLRINHALDGVIVDACIKEIRKLADSKTVVVPVHCMQSIETDSRQMNSAYTTAVKGLSRILPDPAKDNRLRRLIVPVCAPPNTSNMGHYYFFVIKVNRGKFSFPFEVYNSAPNYLFCAEWSPAAASKRLLKFLIHLGFGRDCTQGSGGRSSPASKPVVWGHNGSGASPLHSMFCLVFSFLFYLALVSCFETHTHNTHRDRWSSY
jgi:hypothetical protein